VPGADESEPLYVIQGLLPGPSAPGPYRDATICAARRLASITTLPVRTFCGMLKRGLGEGTPASCERSTPSAFRLSKTLRRIQILTGDACSPRRRLRRIKIPALGIELTSGIFARGPLPCLIAVMREPCGCHDKDGRLTLLRLRGLWQLRILRGLILARASPLVRRDFAEVLCVGSPGVGLASGACARLVLVLT